VVFRFNFLGDDPKPIVASNDLIDYSPRYSVANECRNHDIRVDQKVHRPAR